ncbi:DUF6745 domain-containing protein [Streptomyces alkaliphilus]|uniref:DUF6745 domain-containing protein n=1 Tax=Streptomyces alkaliphilus TaxID=1472722 RepID=UPI002B20FD5E|nr:hypothetical protein [Streptomyces alkaliphilus]
MDAGRRRRSRHGGFPAVCPRSGSDAPCRPRRPGSRSRRCVTAPPRRGRPGREPDGSRRTHWLGVPPRTRTATEGAARSFGVEATEYAPRTEG